MAKSKEELAKEYSSRFSPDNGWGAEISNEAFLAGYDARQAEIERLKKDKARLDWVIETKSQAHKTDKGWFTFPINILGDFTSSPREAIDAAMKESKDGK